MVWQYRFTPGSNLPLQQQHQCRPQEWCQGCPSTSSLHHPCIPMEKTWSQGKEALISASQDWKSIIHLLVHAEIISVTCYTKFHGSFSRKGQDPCTSLLPLPQVLQAILMGKKCSKFPEEQKTRWLQWKLHRAQTYPLTCSWTGQSAYVAVPLTGTSRSQKPLSTWKPLEMLEQEQGYAVMLRLIRISLFSQSFAPLQPQQAI